MEGGGIKSVIKISAGVFFSVGENRPIYNACVESTYGQHPPISSVIHTQWHSQPSNSQDSTGLSGRRGRGCLTAAVLCCKT